MPKVRLKFFGQYREWVEAETAELEANTPAEALASLGLLERFADSTGMLAVNQEVAGLDTPLNDNDEIGLLPPMTGG